MKHETWYIRTRMSEPEAWKTSREAGKTDFSGLVQDDEAGKSDYSGAAAQRFNSMRVSTV